MISVYCDGGSRGNPGPAAYGFVIKNAEMIIGKGKGRLGVATNNFAEYTALIEALKWLSQNHRREEVEVFVDSQLVASQLSGTFKVKSATIRELVFKVRQLEANFKKVKYAHIPRDKNWEADQLVNEALDDPNGT